MEIQLAFNNPRPTKRGNPMRKKMHRKSNPEITLIRKVKTGKKTNVQKQKLLIPNSKDMKTLRAQSKDTVRALKKQKADAQKDLRTFASSAKNFRKDQLKALAAAKKEGWDVAKTDRDLVKELGKGVKVAKKKKKVAKKITKKAAKKVAKKVTKKPAKKKAAKKAPKKIKKTSPKKLSPKKASPKKKTATKKKAKKTKKASKKVANKTTKKIVAPIVEVAQKKKPNKKKTSKKTKKTKKASKKAAKKTSKKTAPKKATKKNSKKAPKSRKTGSAKKAVGFKTKGASKSVKKTKKNKKYGVQIKKGKPFFSLLNNPFGGNMLKKVEKVIGHDVMEAGGLLVGGASIQGINHAISKFAPTLKNSINSVPFIGAMLSKNIDAIIPLALGIAANHFVKNDKVKAVAKGVIGASVVNIGASLYNAAAVMSGATMSGIVAVPNMGGINYQQNDYGMGRIVNDSMAGEAKALGVESTDFGGMGYVESADFDSLGMSGYDDDSASMN